MPRSLKVYITGVVTLSALALVVATLVFDADKKIALLIGQGTAENPSSTEIALGVLFWTLLTLVTSALPVRLPLGTHQAVSMAPIVAAMALGGPAVAGWVAAIGTTELREVRGRIPWYGTLANHAGATLPAIVAGIVYVGLVRAFEPTGPWDLPVNFAATIAGSRCAVCAQHRHCKRAARPSDRPVVHGRHRR